MTNTMQELKNKYPVNTFLGETQREILELIQSEKDLSKKEAQEEYKQFILNILDGIDIADGECNTKAIRLAISSRII